MADIPLTMPKMSMTMEEGTLTEWQVSEGDTIAKGDVVAVVMTDKVDMEVESPAAGTVSRILVQEGDVIAVGAPMATIASEEEDLLGDLFSGGDDDAAASDPDGSDGGKAPMTSAQSDGAASADEARRVPPAVPLARKLARDHGIELSSLRPTGPHGTVRVKDVKLAISLQEEQAGAEQQQESRTAPTSSDQQSFSAPVVQAPSEELLGDARHRRTRQLTAAAMQPTTAVPQFTAFRTIDLSVAARARTATLKGISWTTLVLRSYAMMLRSFPQLNGYWAGDGVKRNDDVAVVLAVDTPGGLLVPVLRDPDQRPLRDLDQHVRSISADAKEGRVDPSLFGPATGTVSNLGGLGVDRFNALITPPQATALSVGRVGHIPVVADDGTFEAHTACELGLTIDHRAADGADAARALQHIQGLFDDPLQLAL